MDDHFQHYEYLKIRTVLASPGRTLKNMAQVTWSGSGGSEQPIAQAKVSHAVFEEWWRQERHTWELAIRLGRFYRQWQTRRDAVESRRNWIESFGQEARPVPYPNADQRTDMPDIGDFRATQQIL